MKVLVGIDFRGRSSKAALELAQAYKQQLSFVLLHVIEEPKIPGFFQRAVEQSAATIETLKEGAESRLSELANKISTYAKVSHIVITGKPAEILSSMADLEEADIILVADNEQEGARTFNLGSVAEKITSAAKIPVFVARDMPEQFSSIIVSVDESEHSMRALALARNMADFLKVTLQGLHVLTSAIYGHLVRAYGADRTEAIEQEYRENTQLWFQKNLQNLGLNSSQVKLKIRRGNTAQEILLETEEHKSPLLILGSRGAGGMQAMFGGRVSRAVLRGSKCSVIVVP